MDQVVTAAPALLNALEEAAERFGVERKYWDIWGKPHEASEETLRTILSSLGVDTSSEHTLQQAEEDQRFREWSRPVPETIVASQTATPVLLTLPSARASGGVRLSIDFENGSRREWDVPFGSLIDIERRRIAGHDLVRKRFVLGDDLPLGYHCLTVEAEGVTTVTARLIVCPDRAWLPDFLKRGKTGGIAVSLYGLRSQRNWGCGDTTDLAHLADWATSLGVSFIALNPLHSIGNRQPYNTSPYLPNSIFYRNPIYLDVEKIEDFGQSHWAGVLFSSARIRTEVEALRASEYVEYERVSRLKTEFLKICFLNFLIKEYRRDTSRAGAFVEYVKKEGELLHQFAVHAALDETLHRRDPKAWNWKAWPEQYRDPHSGEVAAFEAKHWRGILFHKYAQWQLDLQFREAQQYALDRGLGIGLYHDMALATDRFGSDLWAHRPFYAEGCRVGSPPDDFAPKGQDWGFPPPNSRRHLEDGYRLFAESIRKASAHGGALRIDHVMRFFRLFWIPDGGDATKGTYVQDRFGDLIRVLALESVRNRFLVIGEDLGTVPDSVRDTLREFGILSYRLFFFEKDRSGQFRPPENYPAQALVSATTHDLPTLAGFWHCTDIEARRAAGILPEESYRRAIEERLAEKAKMVVLLKKSGLLPDWVPSDPKQTPELTGELHNAIIGFLASTPSQLFVVNQEDLFKETHQQNLPGTTTEYPNWRRKMIYSVEQLQSPETQPYASMFRDWLKRTARLNHMK